MAIYGYIRVSTDKQTTENQRFEIERFLSSRRQAVDVWINETVSGTVQYTKRKIGKKLKQMKKGDILICSELSRLGRTTLDILTILNICIEKHVLVWTVKENYQLNDGIQSQMLAFIFSMLAQLERTLISQRTKEALSRLKSEGKQLGRIAGSKNKTHILDGKEEQIIEMLNKGISKKEIARKIKVSYGTIYNFIKK